MTAQGLLPIKWLHRDPPLAPAAVAAYGSDCIKQLVLRLSLREETTVKRVRFVFGENILVAMAAEEDLPWSDGAIFLGSQPGSNLFLPTNLTPSIPIQIFERAFNNKFPRVKPPLAVLPTVPAVFSLSESFVTNMDSLRKYSEKL